ncbi:MAG TPA: hypothetical protein VN840_16170 [Streptosporangiaceae bacterium]|nr:hypothetical protein [Streptosporangiaceae bacterium]
MTEPIRTQVQARIVWGDLESLPVVAASHFIAQASIHDAPNVNDIVLTLGYLPPPVFLGTHQEQAELAAGLGEVTVTPSARFIMSTSKAAELAHTLSQILEIIEANRQQP